MRVMVTGANGFIGSKLVHRLVLGDHELIALVRPQGNRGRLADLRGGTVAECDLEDYPSVDRAIGEHAPDLVVHLATRYAVEHDGREAQTLASVNVVGTINLLEALRKSPGTGLINTSSCFVYAPQTRPLKETDPLLPFNLYALTKLQAEEACRFYAFKYGSRTVNLRLFPPYGPGDTARKMIPSFIRAVRSGNPPEMTRGVQAWDYIYIEDVVDAYELVIEKFDALSGAGFETYNLGTGKARTVRSIAETILELMGSDVQPQWGSLPERPNELYYLCAEIDKIERTLNWVPSTDIRKGLESTIAWFEQDRPGAM